MIYGVAGPTIHILLCVIIVVSSERGNKQCGLLVPPTVTSRSNKVLIAHRGASFHLPEHTLQAYRLALELGTDYIEPDLVSTKDGKLVAYHNVDLNATTNIAEKFPDRSSFSEYANTTGYWVYDFDLHEIKQLRVKQAVTDVRTEAFDGLFTIPTLQEILELLHNWNEFSVSQLQSTKQRAGLYAELKDPLWFAAETQINLIDVFIQELSSSPHANSIFNDTDCESLKFDEYLTPPLVVQCFEGNTLKDLAEQWNQNYGIPPPMVLLGDVEHCLEEDWWFQIGSEWGHFLHGVGPDKQCFAEETSAKSFMERAEEHDLAVHVWTERPERTKVLDAFDDMDQEMDYMLCTVGVHGIFTEDVARSAKAISRSCGNMVPTESPSVRPDPPDNPCPDESALKEETMHLAIATGTMGLLMGCIFSSFIINSRYCKSRRHTRLQLRVPTQEEIEVI